MERPQATRRKSSSTPSTSTSISTPSSTDKSRVSKQPGDLLSAEEKKANHIASEKKRRAAIRVGFDKITAIVPDLDEGQGRSEAIVLTKTVDFLTQLLGENEKLQQAAQQNNVPLELKEIRRNPY